MSGPAPRLDPVSPGRLLARQFVTLVLLMISLAITFTFLFVQSPAPSTTQHSTILLVWSGVRPDMVSAALTPHLAAIGDVGIIATDHHASVTMPLLPNGTTSDDTSVVRAAPSQVSTPTATPVVITPATNGVQSDLTTLFQTALAKGLGVSYEGAGGTALLQSLTNPTNAFILDDQTTYPASLAAQLQQAQVTPPAQLPAADATHVPDIAHTEALTQAFIQVLLPQLKSKATSAPFFSVIRYPDPATTATFTGIGGAAMNAALRSDDNALGELIAGLHNAGIYDSVNIIVTSDHGLADVVAPGNTSATTQAYTAPTDAVRTNVATLLAQAANLGTQGPLPDVGKTGVSTGKVGPQTTVIVAASGGSDAITIPASNAVQKIGQGNAQQGQTSLTQDLVTFLQQTPQIGPIFVNDRLGKPDGTLPLSTLFAITDQSPAIFFSFQTFAYDIGQRGTNINQFAGSTYADTTALATWGTLSRRDLHTIFYAQGPSFKQIAQDIAPTGAADVVPTLASILHLTLPTSTQGRIISEILANGTDSGNAPTQHTTASTERVLGTNGPVYLEVVVSEQFGGITYLEDAYAIRAPTAQPPDTLISQAVALGGQE